MINHARTLLLNVASTGEFVGRLGEELSPPFTPVRLPTYVSAIRTQLFGQSPDLCMLYYRVRQLLALTHATPLEEYLLASDPRITYSLSGYDWPDSEFTPSVIRTAGSDADVLTVVGVPSAPDVSGRCLYDFDVQAVSPDTVRVDRLTPGFKSADYAYDASGGVSAQVPLDGTGYSFVLSSGSDYRRFRVTTLNRPQYDVSALADAVGRVGEANLDQLFGIAAAEPYQTFRNLWFKKRELPLKVGALVCAVVMRTDERRLAGG